MAVKKAAARKRLPSGAVVRRVLVELDNSSADALDGLVRDGRLTQGEAVRRAVRFASIVSALGHTSLVDSALAMHGVVARWRERKAPLSSATVDLLRALCAKYIEMALGARILEDLFWLTREEARALLDEIGVSWERDGRGETRRWQREARTRAAKGGES